MPETVIVHDLHVNKNKTNDDGICWFDLGKFCRFMMLNPRQASRMVGKYRGSDNWLSEGLFACGYVDVDQWNFGDSIFNSKHNHAKLFLQNGVQVWAPLHNKLNR